MIKSRLLSGGGGDSGICTFVSNKTQDLSCIHYVGSGRLETEHRDLTILGLLP